MVFQPPPLILLDLEHPHTERPCDVPGSGDDTRFLSLGLSSLKVSCSLTKRVIANFDLAGQYPFGFNPIYGFGEPEPWGVWCDGKRSRVLLTLPEFPAHGCDISLTYMRAPWCELVDLYINYVPLGCRALSDETELTFSAEPYQFWRTANEALHNVSLIPGRNSHVTVVMINYNRWDLTFACVLAILGSETEFDYDIIIVDNGSNLESADALVKLQLPARILQLPERRSFGEVNNFAAEKARGSNLLLLNNDAFVASDCISRLMRVVKPGSAAGPVFEWPDGRLQEAGSFINVDATSIQRRFWNFQGQLSELSPTSEVDYISAACLMISRNDYLRLGGFDPAYEPAYYEDTDLCCRLRALGGSVVLARDARVMHVLSATSKTLSPSDPAADAVIRTREIFRSRWSRWLWTRDFSDQARADELTFTDNDSFESSGPMNAFLISDPLLGDSETYALLTHCAAVAQDAPTLLASPTAYSRLRLLHLTRKFSIPASGLKSTDFGSLNAECLKSVIQSSHELPPPVAHHGKRATILYCPNALPANYMRDEELRERIDWLTGFHRIVTNSELSKRRILDILTGTGLTNIPVEVIIPPIPKWAHSREEPKETLVVSVGPFQASNLSRDGHATVLRAFLDFCRGHSDRRWRLICMGEIAKPQEISCYLDLHASAASEDSVRFLLNPTRQQTCNVLSRAALCVSADMVEAAGDLGQHYPDCAVLVHTAITFGCIPIVPMGGVSAELCAKLGVGLFFNNHCELKRQLHAAEHLAFAEKRGWAGERICEESLESWRRVLRELQGTR